MFDMVLNEPLKKALGNKSRLTKNIGTVLKHMMKDLIKEQTNNKKRVTISEK